MVIYTEPTVFEKIRKTVMREKRETLSWEDVNLDGSGWLCYEASHSGLVAARIYVNADELRKASVYRKQVKKNRLYVNAASSRAVTGEQFTAR